MASILKSGVIPTRAGCTTPTTASPPERTVDMLDRWPLPR
jgi:hypothetical protein